MNNIEVQVIGLIRFRGKCPHPLSYIKWPILYFKPWIMDAAESLQENKYDVKYNWSFRKLILELV